MEGSNPDRKGKMSIYYDSGSRTQGKGLGTSSHPPPSPTRIGPRDVTCEIRWKPGKTSSRTQTIPTILKKKKETRNEVKNSSCINILGTSSLNLSSTCLRRQVGVHPIPLAGEGRIRYYDTETRQPTGVNANPKDGRSSTTSIS